VDLEQDVAANRDPFRGFLRDASTRLEFFSGSSTDDFRWLTTRFIQDYIQSLVYESSVFLHYLTDVILAHRFPSLFCRRPLPSFTLAPPYARLSLISRHLEQPLLEINTPFSTERLSEEQDDLDYTPVKRESPKSASLEERNKMSNQAEHPALLIPGPIEFDDVVLQSMGHFRFDELPWNGDGRPTDPSLARAMSVLPSSPLSARHFQCFESSSKHQIRRLNLL